MFHGAVGRAAVAVAFFEGTPQKTIARHFTEAHKWEKVSVLCL